MAGESKRDLMIIDRDIATDTFKNEQFLTGERSAIIIKNEEKKKKKKMKKVCIKFKAFNTCNINDISIGENSYIYTSAFYHCNIKRFIIQSDAPRPTETIFWECFINTLIVQQDSYNPDECMALVQRLVHKTDKVTRISNIRLIYRGGSRYLKRTRLRM